LVDHITECGLELVYLNPRLLFFSVFMSTQMRSNKASLDSLSDKISSVESKMALLESKVHTKLFITI